MARLRVMTFNVRDPFIGHDARPPLYPGDHYPVVADLSFGEGGEG